MDTNADNPPFEPDAPAATDAAASETSAIDNSKFRKVPLTTPIMRGETAIAEVTVRKPMGGDLRGCSAPNILMMDMDTMLTILPRVTMPPLLPFELETAVDPLDLMELVGAVKGFFMTAQEKAMVEAMQAQAGTIPTGS